MFLRPEYIDLAALLADNADEFPQAAGHGGFLAGDKELECLKPINPPCVKGRRELLFYQLQRMYATTRQFDKPRIFYNELKLFVDPKKPCDCQVDPEMFRSLGQFVSVFKCIKHWSIGGEYRVKEPSLRKAYEDTLYTEKIFCPCYGENKEAKFICSIDYMRENFLCMTDHHVHCRLPCIMDVKMGRVTYDPMASHSKMLEQIQKYPRLCDFGFRILGIRTPEFTRRKDYGRRLDGQEQVFEAFENFLRPLETSHRKVVVTDRMVNILERLLEWFETKSGNQLRFYGTSLLFVYDAAQDIGIKDQDRQPNLTKSVRVAMIDFAHVFHSHDPPSGPSRSGSFSSIATSGDQNKDDNYLYGLRRLIKFFIMLNRQHRSRVSEMIVPPYPRPHTRP